MSQKTFGIVLVASLFTCFCGSKDNKNKDPAVDKKGAQETSAPTESAPPEEGRTITDRLPIAPGGGDTTGPSPSPVPSDRPTPQPSPRPSPTPSPTPLPTPGVGVNGTYSLTSTYEGNSWNECLQIVNYSDNSITKQCSEVGGVFKADAKCSSVNLIGVCTNQSTSDGLAQHLYRTGNAQFDLQLRESNKANCQAPFVWQEPR
jgi:hypothetical protein